MVEPHEALTISVPEAARIIGIGPRSAYRAVRAGLLPVIYVGDRIRVLRRPLARLLDPAGPEPAQEHGDGGLPPAA
jgi:hypothetical protein